MATSVTVLQLCKWSNLRKKQFRHFKNKVFPQLKVGAYFMGKKNQIGIFFNGLPKVLVRQRSPNKPEISSNIAKQSMIGLHLSQEGLSTKGTSPAHKFFQFSR